MVILEKIKWIKNFNVTSKAHHSKSNAPLLYYILTLTQIVGWIIEILDSCSTPPKAIKIGLDFNWGENGQMPLSKTKSSILPHFPN